LYYGVINPSGLDPEPAVDSSKPHSRADLGANEGHMIIKRGLIENSYCFKPDIPEVGGVIEARS